MDTDLSFFVSLSRDCSYTEEPYRSTLYRQLHDRFRRSSPEKRGALHKGSASLFSAETFWKVILEKTCCYRPYCERSTILAADVKPTTVAGIFFQPSAIKAPLDHAMASNSPARTGFIQCFRRYLVYRLANAAAIDGVFAPVSPQANNFEAGSTTVTPRSLKVDR